MQHKLTYSIVAWGILFAFGAMMIVKDTHYHHHHAHADCAIHCVLDGEVLDSHHTHHHTSFLPAISDDEDCLICNFHVAKVRRTAFAVFLMPTTEVRKVDTAYIIHFNSPDFLSAPLRAPPAVGYTL
ncbi:MAG: DUF2946 family protein [Paludibacteraceae bacterium]|nr:DUF2946 family protein [Paludibacteraceae bacterium]